MIAILLAVFALCIASGFGRFLLSFLKNWEPNPAERFAYAGALGLGIAGYGVYFLGLLGLLGKIQITLWWLLLGAIGFKGILANLQDLIAGVKSLFIEGAVSERAIRFAILLTLTLLGGITILAAFLAPTGMQWDAVAYHLADPKVFLQQGRITSLPTEHHSNFPFTMEMLFLTGLLYADFPLANLFHFLTEILVFAAILGFARRYLTSLAGWIGVLLFATTPVVFWEAGAAYIDIGLGLYIALGAFAAISLILETAPQKRQSWTILAGIMIGFALGVKYLALLPLLFIGGLLILKRIPLKQVALFATLAGAIASPWYAKNWVVMKNPVYPYLYKVFSQSKYWSADRGATYDSEQQSFGYAHSLKQPSETLRNLLMTPFNLLSNAQKYSNAGEYTFMALYGGLWSAFGLALLSLRGIPSPVRMAMGLGGSQLLAWFFVAQVSRYLISFLPLLAVGCGYAALRLCEYGTTLLSEKSDSKLKASRFVLAVRILIASALGGQAILLLASLLVLPTSGRAANELGVLPTVLNLPALLQDLNNGRDSRVTREMETYSAIQYIHEHSIPSEGVVLYEETRGFYLNRPYLWGNGEHSSYIPYTEMRDGADLARWFHTHGMRYALINMNFAPFVGDPELPSPRRAETEALQRWYVDKATVSPGGWRYVLGDALRRRLLHPVFAERGVVVLEMAGGE
ncbi:MAG: hypothetical protein NT023_17600 [Armatimonadetes bacterium]|nr:hypothetical protein [Armatimonadota bacterium]